MKHVAVLFTALAEEDLDQIEDCVSAHDPAAAARVRASISPTGSAVECRAKCRFTPGGLCPEEQHRHPGRGDLPDEGELCPRLAAHSALPAPHWVGSSREAGRLAEDRGWFLPRMRFSSLTQVVESKSVRVRTLLLGLLMPHSTRSQSSNPRRVRVVRQVGGRYNLAMKFRLLLDYDAQAGRWSAVFPDLPGCASAGDTEEEAVTNAKEALALWFDPTPRGHSEERQAPRSRLALSHRFSVCNANDVVRVLRRHGFACVSQRGSHQKWRHASGRQVIVAPVRRARALYQQPGRAGHSHDQSAPENLRLLPHAPRSADFLSHPQLPEHLPQTRPKPLAGDPKGRHGQAFHPLSTSRWPLRRE